MTSHFEESTITGTLQMSGSDAMRFRNLRHRGDAVNHSFVHANINDLRAVLDLLAGDGERGLVIAGLDELGEFRRPGDVGALADVDEIGIRTGSSAHPVRSNANKVQWPALCAAASL